MASQEDALPTGTEICLGPTSDPAAVCIPWAPHTSVEMGVPSLGCDGVQELALSWEEGEPLIGGTLPP